jgi:hypothetical protein
VRVCGVVVGADVDDGGDARVREEVLFDFVFVVDSGVLEGGKGVVNLSAGSNGMFDMIGGVRLDLHRSR